MKRIFKDIFARASFGRFVFHVRKNNRPMVALSFDDGPHAGHSKMLLDILAEERVTATFFVLGSEAEKHPELLAAIAAGGHEIGNHSFMHEKISNTGYRSYREGVERTSRMIQEYAQQQERLFRPPFGELNLPMIRYILGSRYTYVGWSVDSNDSYVRTKEELTRVMESTPLQSGDIILFHEDYSWTIEALPEVIQGIKKRGYEVASVGELIRSRQ